MPLLVRAALALLVLYVVARQANILLARDALLPVFAAWTVHACYAAAVALIVWAGLRRHGAERAGWLLLAAGLVAWAFGDVYWSHVLAEADAPPVPSPADIGYLSFVPLAFAGICLLVRGRGRHGSSTLWLDGLTAALAAGAVSAAVVVDVVLANVGGSVAEVATNLAYPIADLVLMGIVAGSVALRGWRLDRTSACLAAGLVSFWVADSIYLVQIAQGSYSFPSPYDVGWILTYVAAAAAAWQPRDDEQVVRVAGGTRIIALPVAFAGASLAVLAYGALAGSNPVAVALASASLIAVLARLWLTFRAHAAMLADSRREATTDALTGLGNRRALMRALECAGQDRPAVLVLFDLDGFKHYNDSYGHPAGDALLVRLGAQLAQRVDGIGSAYRMGGDEFCAVLREVPGATVEETVADVAQALSEHGEGFMIGCSYGWVALPGETARSDEALRLADQRMYAHKHGTRLSARRQTRDVLLRALSERNPELGAHLTDVAELAERVARALGLRDFEVESVRHAAELHDVGKVAIPDAILNKPGPLSGDEWEFMRRHTIIGERIITAAPALDGVAKLVRSSHERHDGTGYPDGLAGRNIPLGARIVAVCDAYDAMTTDRPYRSAMAPDEALAELRRCAGAQFDPAVIDAFGAVLEAPRQPLRAVA